MNGSELRNLLEAVSMGLVDLDEAAGRLSKLPFEDLGFAHIDHHRVLRRGYGEAIYCAGKTTDQVVAIAERMVAYGHENILATRAEADTLDALERRFSARIYGDSRLAVVNPKEVSPVGLVCVCTGGTSDIPAAEEAAVTAEVGGSRVERLYDVGVAGIHRLLAKTDVLSEAHAIIVVAGMEGALASVVGGMVSCPVIAVPTSVGYGASFGGIAALLSMLNSCSPGISVVNIDNGYGAGYQANVINRMTMEEPVRRCATEGVGETVGDTAAEGDSGTKNASPRTAGGTVRDLIAIRSPARLSERNEIDDVKIAHLDPFSGVSGDMFLGALVDAGMPVGDLSEAIGSLGVPGLVVSADTVRRGGLAATKVTVTYPPQQTHRHLREIVTMIEEGDLPETVKADAISVFYKLGEAEASIHGVGLQKVHFHEVGAADAIADVVGTVWGLDALGAERVTVGSVNVGAGLVKCDHGTLPVPAPATLRLLKEWKVFCAGPRRELTTPTGAALVTVLGDQVEGVPPMTVERDGYGAGGSDPKGWSNVLRLTVGAAARHGECVDGTESLDVSGAERRGEDNQRETC